MRIVNIILTSQNGGAEQVFVDYLVALKNIGHDVLAVTKTDAPYADKIAKLGIPVHKIKNNFGYNDIFAVSNLKNILQKFDADVVVSHAGRAIVLSRKAIKKIKSKKVLEVAVNHSMNVKRSIGADVVLCVNKKIFFRSIDLGQSEKASFVIHNIIDLKDAILEVPKVDLQKKETITIGVMGRLDKTKGFCHAIKAIKSLEKISDKKFILKIAGTGPREGYLRNLVYELAVGDQVEFCGWVSDKKEFFSSIDIFCLPSEEETFGLVLLEAMKYCKPIISTDADGPKEILRDKQDSLIVSLEPVNEVADKIANAVVEVVNNSELTNMIVENSSIKVKEKFSSHLLERKMKDIFGGV